MKKPVIPAVSAAAITALLVSCIEPLPPAPAPHFRPNPPYPPQPVDPYADHSPYGQPSDVSPPADDTASTPTRPGEYPTAKPTTKPDEVVSPYEPYNIINVEGYKPGELVRDPHNKKIFRVP
jgi:hypothetical protein